MLKKVNNFLDLKKHLRSNLLIRAVKSISESSRQVTFKPLEFLVDQIQNYQVDLVLDVGANVGQFAQDLILSGYKHRIMSFEPISSQFDLLQHNARKRKHWETFNLAFGDKNSEENIFVSGNSGLSSSFLRMNETHLNNFPSSKIVGTEKVKITTINDFLINSNLKPQKCLLKIDVQGFESKVLSGCQNYLNEFALCFLEISLVPLYEAEPTYIEILNYLENHGQNLIGLRTGVKSKDGELLQLDILTKRAF